MADSDVSMPNCQELAKLARFGAGLGLAMANNAIPKPGSPLDVLDSRRGTIPDGSWPASDIVLLRETLLGLISVAAFQLNGVGDLLTAGPPVNLYPLVTLVRGVAEACGQIWWHLEPWLDDKNVGTPVAEGAWDVLSGPIPARMELAYLDALARRRRRVEVAHGPGSAEYAKADKEVADCRTSLTHRHNQIDVKVSGARTKWAICGEKLPEATTLATAATEYAYGQHTRGSGTNPYPMLSGYAHGSLDTIFAGAGTTRTPFSELHSARPTELRRIVALATRTFAAGYEIVAGVFDWDLADLQAWERVLGPLTIG